VEKLQRTSSFGMQTSSRATARRIKPENVEEKGLKAQSHPGRHGGDGFESYIPPTPVANGVELITNAPALVRGRSVGESDPMGRSLRANC
jgi:hypothetical protein